MIGDDNRAARAAALESMRDEAMRTIPRFVRFGGLAGLALWGAVALGAAQSLPRLPKDFVFVAAEGPGPVTFSHEIHVAVQGRPDCVTCHPKLFKTLAPGRTADGRPITHADMEQKRQCGACHDGQHATGLDDCAHCHRSQ